MSNFRSLGGHKSTPLHRPRWNVASESEPTRRYSLWTVVVLGRWLGGDTALWSSTSDCSRLSALAWTHQLTTTVALLLGRWFGGCLLWRSSRFGSTFHGNCTGALGVVVLTMCARTSMSVLLIIGTKRTSTLAAPHAAPWWVTASMRTVQTDWRTGASLPDRYISLSDTASV